MPIPPAIRMLLSNNNINNGMPAWIIIDNAQLLPPLPLPGPGPSLPFADTVPTALRKLMASYFRYGRQHWTWTMMSPAGAANGGLVKGHANNCACATFNYNFKWLAETLCGINGITQGQIFRQFLTVPGGHCIDSKWVGNVSSSKRTAAQLRVFKFTDHYFLKYGGMNYDVCFNNTFANDNDIVWTRLESADPKLLAKYDLQSKQFYKLARTIPEIPRANHLVCIQQTGPNNWPSWLLVSQDELEKVLARRRLRRFW